MMRPTTPTNAIPAIPAAAFAGERRIHIGLAVTDLERAKHFYTTLFGGGPVKERPGYAKFEPADPSVNLALNESTGPRHELPAAEHLGVQVKTAEAVAAAAERFRAAGFPVEVEDETTCCYAVQTKMWATDPDGARWEVFVVLEADAGERAQGDAACCVSSCCGGEER